jgi:hypothetical protein
MNVIQFTIIREMLPALSDDDLQQLTEAIQIVRRKRALRQGEASAPPIAAPIEPHETPEIRSFLSGFPALR